MNNALWITLVGMGMVFFVILLLWGLIAVLVRLTREKEPQQQVRTNPETTGQAAPQNQPDQTNAEQRRRAAAASAAVALALSNQKEPSRAGGPGQSISPWLIAQRTAHLNRNAPIFQKRVTR